MNKKFILGIAAAAAIAVGGLSTSAEGFAKTNTYTPGMFSDVPASEWYASTVDGKDVTLAEKFTLRDRLPVVPLFMLYKLDETNYTFENNTLTASSLDKKFEEIAQDRVAYQYEFEVPGDLDGFVGYTTTAYVQNGFLSGDAVERVDNAVPDDPRLALTGISLDTLFCNKIVIGMKYELLDTDSTNIEVYYATDVDSALSQDKSALVMLGA